jgi:hypothetical protein
MFYIKKIIIRVTKFLGVYSILKKLQLQIILYLGLGHGHSLLLKLLKKKPYLYGENKVFIEIGSSRTGIFGQGSTELIANFCEKKKTNFITVDTDKNTINLLKKKFKNYKYTKVVHDIGENFSKRYKKKVSIIYLDAFDIFIKNQSKERILFYKNNLKKNISNKESAKMHFIVIKNFLKNLNEACFIVFDDTFINKNKITGKGKTAIPLLLKNKFSIIGKNKNSIAVERKSNAYF